MDEKNDNSTPISIHTHNLSQNSSPIICSSIVVHHKMWLQT